MKNINKIVVNELSHGVLDFFKNKNEEPIFYTISGSHLYGFPSESSDIDIRGFHIAPDSEFVKLNTPKEQYEKNELRKDGVKTDMVSYELRKFGKLIHKMNFNVLEWLYNSHNIHYQIYNANPKEVNDLIKKLKPYQGMVARHYYGMAKGNYHRWLKKEGKGKYTPTPKKFLYVTRGLLGALIAVNNKTVVPNIKEMILTNIVNHYDPILSDDVKYIIDDLIELKINEKNIPTADIEKYQETLEKLFKIVENEKFPKNNKNELREKINEWMINLRNNR